jgi:outer membrane protein insertion porin family
MRGKSFFFFFFLILSHLLVGQIDTGTGQSFRPSYSNPSEFEIAGIEVTGAHSLDPASIISVTGLKIGDKITVPGEKISGAIKKLWKQGILGDIKVLVQKVEGNFIFLELLLTERPRLSKFGFREVKRGTVENLKKTDSDELKEKLHLIRGRVVTDALIRNSELRIEKYYRAKGFLNITVESNEEEDPLLKNSVVLNFHISKGKKVKINEIFFVGNEKLGGEKIEGKMKKTKEKMRVSLGKNLNRDLLKLDTLSFNKVYNRFKELQFSEVGEYLGKNLNINIFASSKFNRKEFEGDKDLVVNYYKSHGYRDAGITWDSIVQVSPFDIDLYIGVDEGERYYHRKIIWNGNYLYDKKTLNRILGIKRGDIYNKDLLDKRLNFNPTGMDISSLYMDDGYLFFNIQPVEISVEGDSIDLEMRVYEGTQATVNRISISGNTVTSDEVILREIRTLPGYKFSRRDIIRTQTQLAQMGYFDAQQIGIIPKPNPTDGTVDIDYSVVETPSNQIELSGGWGGFYGFVGSLGLVINNFSLKKMFDLSEWNPLPSGDGQRLSLRAQANGRQFQSYSLSFTEPWMGGRKPNSFTVSFNHSRQNNIDRRTNRIFGHLFISGVTLGVGKRLTWPDDYFVWNNSVSFLLYDIQNAGFGLDQFEGIARNINFNTTISRNSVDNPTYPRTGSIISLGVTLTPPYSLFQDESYLESANRFAWIEFNKWMFDNAWYVNPVGNLVISGRIHFGLIGAYNPGFGTGPFERFNVGGSGLAGQNLLLGTEVIGLRGYEDGQVRPYENGRQIDGVAYNKYVLELRYPLSLNPAATIYGLTFLEGGNNFNDYQTYNPFKNYKAAGFGVRIFMPAFGLIGFDWAYGLDPPPGQSGISGSRFHFTIGQQIR